nr:MAG TPA: Interferon-induced 35 kDa protein (IFP 35) N-terminus [Caudoviricetes sp.]
MEEREKQLQEEIERLQAQLKALKEQVKIDWSKYYNFGKGKYNYGGLVGEHRPCDYLRMLAQRLCSLYDHGIANNGLHSIWYNDMPMISKLTKEQAEYINGFIDECYPIVEKYALISLERNKELPNPRQVVHKKASKYER